MLHNDATAGRKPFGRRIDQRADRLAEAQREPVLPEAPAEPLTTVAPDLQARPVDREWDEWTKARRRNFRLPWRQLYFLATVFLGIASLALPDWVNDEVDWLLYALMAASLYAGFRARRRA